MTEATTGYDGKRPDLGECLMHSLDTKQSQSTADPEQIKTIVSVLEV